jgi:hypothetical protein
MSDSEIRALLSTLAFRRANGLGRRIELGLARLERDVLGLPADSDPEIEVTVEVES